MGKTAPKKIVKEAWFVRDFVETRRINGYADGQSARYLAVNLLEKQVGMYRYVLLPGLADMHTHSSLGVFTLPGVVDGKNVKSKEELKELITEAVKDAESTALTTVAILSVPSKVLYKLSRKDLDDISDKVKIFVVDPSYHGGITNTPGWKFLDNYALEMAALDIQLRGSLSKEGVWKEQYLNGILIAIEESNPERFKHEVFSWLLDRLFNEGVVAIGDMAVMTKIELEAINDAYERWKQEGLELPFPIKRVGILEPLVLRAVRDEEIKELINKINAFATVGIKMILDGSIGSDTALIGNKGIQLLYLKDFLRVANAFKQTFKKQPLFFTHAIGDKAILRALDIYKELASHDIKGGIEHNEIVTGEVLRALVDAYNAGYLLGVSQQMTFNTDIETYKDKLGDLVRRVNPLRDLIKAGIPVIGGTDTMPEDMWNWIHAALYHPFIESRVALDEAISIAALRNYTNDLRDALREAEVYLLVDRESFLKAVEEGSKEHVRIELFVV